jgi:DNA-binding XRE family transcriptional regulator
MGSDSDSLSTVSWLKKMLTMTRNRLRFSTSSDMKRIKTTYPNLRAWRDALGLSQQEAAYLLGISRPQYSNLESGKSGTTGKRAKFITAKTGVPVDVLVGAV